MASDHRFNELDDFLSEDEGTTDAGSAFDRPLPVSTPEPIVEFHTSDVAPSALALALTPTVLPAENLHESWRDFEAWRRAPRAGTSIERRENHAHLLWVSAPEVEPTLASRWRSRLSRFQHRRLAAAVLVLMVATAVSGWTLRARARSGPNGVLSPSEPDTTPLMPTVVPPIAWSAPSRLPSLVTTPEFPMPAVRAAAGLPPSGRPVMAAGANAEAPLGGPQIDPVVPSMEKVIPGLRSEASTTATVPRMPAADPAGIAAPASAAPIDERMYDAKDADVTPPELIYPRAIKTWPAGSNRDLPFVEVIVNDKGTVDSVKGCEPPKTLAESLELLNALSAVGNWRFRPADKGGRSVKYRLVVVRRLL